MKNLLLITSLIKVNRGEKQAQAWTTRKLLSHFYSDIRNIATLDKNEIKFSNKKYDVTCYFIARKFMKKGSFGLTASLEIKRKEDDEWLWWLDLRQVQHAYYKKNRDYMVIGRFEQYEGSRLQRDWQKVLVPFLNLLTDTSNMDQLLGGEPFQLHERTIKLDRFFDRFPDFIGLQIDRNKLAIWNTSLEESISSYIIKRDPLDLIREGAPSDEYDHEIHEVIHRLEKLGNLPTQEEVIKVVRDTFEESFELKSRYLKAIYKEMGKAIHSCVVAYVKDNT